VLSLGPGNISKYDRLWFHFLYFPTHIKRHYSVTDADDRRQIWGDGKKNPNFLKPGLREVIKHNPFTSDLLLPPPTPL